MKKTISLFTNLLLSSTVFWSVAIAEGNDLIVKVPAEASTYCHMKFPTIRENSLSWERPVLDGGVGNVVDFYGSCDHDPLGADEIKAQRRVLLRGMFEGGE